MVRFEIYEDQAGEYRWRLIAANNEVVAVGEGYSFKQGAVNSAQKVKYWAFSASIVDIT